MSTSSTKIESRDEQPANRIIESLSATVNQSPQQRRDLSDYRTADYGNMASIGFANTLRILYEPNAEDNPIPDQGVLCYIQGEKLPPQLTQLFNGVMGYGSPVDNISDVFQRRTAAHAYVAVVNWFTKHADTIKKRQNMLNLITNTVTVGKSVTDVNTKKKDEELDDYLARLTARLKDPQPEPVIDQELEQNMTASKVSKKTTKTVAPKKAPLPKVAEPAKKKPTIQIETDSESEADLRDDDDDSELPVSESSGLDVDSSESVELPKKKIGKAAKKGGKR